MKRRVDGYMVYGCDDCGKGFKMYLETGLEGIGDGKDHKPVPFTIQCPFCNGFGCHDVAFKRFPLKKRMSPNGRPFFANVRGDDSGVPMNMNNAKPEYFKKKEGDQNGQNQPDVLS